MLYSVAVLALTLLSGAQGQAGQDADGVECVGVAIERPYQNCGSFGGLNVYWTYLEQEAQLNILFESLDNGYTAFGFSDGTEAPMNGANAVLGCQDWGLPDLDEAFEIALPAAGVVRNVDNVAAGIGMNLLAATVLEQTRANGLCGVRFERLAVLADVDNTDVSDLHNILAGTPNIVVWARGPSAAPGVHNIGRGGGSQDFIANQGVISGSPLNALLMVTTDMVTPTPTDGGSIASLSSMLIGAVAALTAALW